MMHPHTLHALAALWSLRAALEHLDDCRAAAVVRRPTYGARAIGGGLRTLRARRAMDALLRAERAERAGGSLTGLKPSAGSAAPVPLALVQADVDARATLVDVAQLLTYHHHRTPFVGPWPREVTRWDRWAVDLADATPAIALTVGTLLREADARARTLCGIGVDLLPLPLAPPCPACDLRALRVQHAAPDSRAWTVACVHADCRCAPGCGCGMEVVVPGVRHIWSAQSALAASLLAGARAAALRAAA